jgi:hypothetical protein
MPVKETVADRTATTSTSPIYSPTGSVHGCADLGMANVHLAGRRDSVLSAE